MYTSFGMYVHSSGHFATIYSNTELVSQCSGFQTNNVCITGVSGHSVNAPSAPCILLSKGPMRLEAQFEQLNVECSKFHGSRGEVSQ